MALVDKLREQYRQCELLSTFDIARSTYQYHCEKSHQVNVQEQVLKQKVQRIYHESRGSAGSRTVSGMLKQQGEQIGRYKARSLMRSLNLVSTHQKKHHYRIAEEASVIAPNHLARDFSVNQPNHVW